MWLGRAFTNWISRWTILILFHQSVVQDVFGTTYGNGSGKRVHRMTTPPSEDFRVRRTGNEGAPEQWGKSLGMRSQKARDQCSAAPAHDYVGPRIAEPVARARGRRGFVRRSVVCLLLLVVAPAAAWLSRHPLLGKAGGLLISEDPLEHADIMVVSTADSLATALEAGQLYREGLAGEVLLAVWKLKPIVTAVRELGIPYPGPAEARTKMTCPPRKEV